MNSLLAAFSFLTAIRIPGSDVSEDDLASSPGWFPLVGIFIGLGLAFIAWLGSNLGAPRVTAFMGVAYLAAVTRGLHLDGLADWADGFGGKDREDALRIMSDSATGSFGITALILMLGGKYLCLVELLARHNGYAALLLAPVLSRFMLSYFLIKAPYARESGAASVFKKAPPGSLIPKAAATALVCILVVSPGKGIIYALAAFAAAWIIYRHSMSRLGGITGDVLGAIAEASELVALITACWI